MKETREETSDGCIDELIIPTVGNRGSVPPGALQGGSPTEGESWVICSTNPPIIARGSLLALQAWLSRRQSTLGQQM